MNVVTIFRRRSDVPLLSNIRSNVVGKQWSNDQLFAAVARLTAALRKFDVRAGDRVVIFAGNRVETFAFALAVLNCGAVAVPLNQYLGKHEIEEVLKAMRPRCCLSDNSAAHEVRETVAECCRLFVSIDEGAGVDKADTSFEDLLAGPGVPLEFGDHDPDSLALLLRTSGSQGLPKVIKMTHSDLFYYFHYHDLVHAQFADSQYPGAPHRPIVSPFPPSHLAAFTIALQGLLMNRPTYLMQDFVPKTYIQLLAQLGVRVAILVPSMYSALLREKQALSEADLSKLELCMAVGEPCPEPLAEQIEAAFGARLVRGYGLTECLPGVAHSAQALNAGTVTPGSCGKVLFEEVRLADHNGLDADYGELWIRNPTVRRCYGDETLNDVRITDGWFKTGDLFFRDADGNYFHRGRVDDMFVCNGKNIYPKEIENVLLRHSTIREVVAAPVCAPGGKTVPAVLVVSELKMKDTDVVEFFLQEGPAYAVPRLVQFVQELPRLASGKVDRVKCRALLQEAT